jgi:cell division protein FtsL
MTIISPSKNLGTLKFILLIFAVIFAGGLFYIYQYNQLVNLKHRIANLEEAIVRSHVLNTDLKDGLYRLTEPAVLKAAAFEKGLILDAKPDYLEIKQWLSDSSR